jgi:hypothetical protein
MTEKNWFVDYLKSPLCGKLSDEKVEKAKKEAENGFIEGMRDFLKQIHCPESEIETILKDL